MSTKIAICIGDYSNGWSDAWIFQAPTKIKSQDQLKAAQGEVAELCNKALVALAAALEGSKAINPRDPAEPCCESFAAFAKDFTKDQADRTPPRFCPGCGAKIEKDRWESAIK